MHRLTSRCIPSSFNEFESIPATANKYVLDDILRKEWGFKVFVVSDYTGIPEMINHGIGDLQTVIPYCDILITLYDY